MTQEQKERLIAWNINLLATYHIDYFRGIVLVEIVEYLCAGGSRELMKASSVCQSVGIIGFEPEQKNYTELLRELREIAREVPLSDTAQSAITYVFGGEWEEAIHAIFKLKRERNEL